MCLFHAANEKIFESHQLLSQSMCYWRSCGTDSCLLNGYRPLCAAPCRAVCTQLRSAWIAAAWPTPAALLQGFHPLGLKNTEIGNEWSRGVV